MPWKMKKIGEGENETEVIECDVETGNPIFIHDDKTETAVRADQLFGKIKAQIESERKLKDSNKTIQAQLEEAKAGLERFANIDPEKYNEMMDKLKNVEGKTLMEAGEVEKIRTQERDTVTTEWQKKHEKEIKKLQEIISKNSDELAKARDMLRNATVSNFFAHSSTVLEKLILTPEQAENLYGKHFRADIDDSGNTVIKGFMGGDVIRSSSKTGEEADPEDALWQIIQRDPGKDRVLKGDNQSGGGTGERGGAQEKGTEQKPTTLKGLTEREKIEAIKKFGQDYINELIMKDLRAERANLKEAMKGYNTQ